MAKSFDEANVEHFAKFLHALNRTTLTAADETDSPVTELFDSPIFGDTTRWDAASNPPVMNRAQRRATARKGV